jgi:hypothetical protein
LTPPGAPGQVPGGSILDSGWLYGETFICLDPLQDAAYFAALNPTNSENTLDSLTNFVAQGDC